MEALLNQYVEDMTAKKINGKKQSTILTDKSWIKKHLMPTFGKFRAAAITKEQVEDFMNQHASGTGKRLVVLLSAIFNFGIRKKIITVNPCTGVQKPVDKVRIRRLSAGEYKTLGRSLTAVAEPTVQSVLRALMVTGWRSGEIRSLRWTECDLPRFTANLENTKSGRSVRPLGAEAIRIIESQPRRNEFVFNLNGKPIRNINYHFAKLGLDKTITPHVLRHSFASLAADLGFGDHVIGSLLGHRQSSITSRYLHLDKSLIEAADTVAQRTLELIAHG